MLDLELSQLPPEIMQILMSRGSGTPPLSWQERRNTLAKKKLDELDDVQLFGRMTVKDEPTAAAVRALLYLWTGWTAEAHMLAQVAVPPDRFFLAALCERQEGRFDVCKELFRKVQTHPIYKPLGDHALRILKSESEPSLRRFREVVEQQGMWEPFAFIDLCDQARSGHLSQAVLQIIAGLQAKEFELLFAHSFAEATGRQIARRRVLSEEEELRREQEYRRRMAERRKEAAKRAKQKLLGMEPKKAPSEEKTPPLPVRPPDPRVKVLCPKCRQLLFVPESARGRTTVCLHCKVVFMVPHKQPEKIPSGAPGRKI